MRRFLIILLVLAALIVGAALLVPSLIPEDALRTRAEAAASETLGREVRLEGDIRLQLLPTAQVRAANARIANAEGFSSEPFAEMEEMRVSVALLPLLSRRVEVEEFVLVSPTIRLETRGGRNNWTLGAPSEAAPAEPPAGGFVRQPGALPLEASFGDVRIENGAFSYSDGVETRTFDQVNIALALPSVDDEMRLSGSFDADGRPMNFDARLGSLRGFFEGAQTPLALSLNGPLADLSFQGQIDEGEDIAFRGDVDMEIPIRALARYLGADLPDGEVFRRFEASARMSGSPAAVTLSGADIVFDDIRLRSAEGMTLRLDGARPALTAAITTARLDLTPYIPADEAPSGSNADGVAPWSNDTMDLAPLRLLDADLTIRADRFKARDVEATDVVINTELENGRLAANLTGFDLYGGRGRVDAVVNARRATPSYSFFADVDNLEALPFLTAAAGFDRLRGLGGLRLDLTAAGASPAAIMNSLNGEGNFSFADGAIVGVNLAQVIRTVQDVIASGQLPAGFSEQQQTDFTSLGGSFTVTNGTVQNLDLAMLSPLIRVAGEGTVDLPNQVIDYRLTPRAVSSLSGQGGAPDLQGVGVPILLRGDFNNVSAGVDFATLIRELARAELADQLPGGLGDLLNRPDQNRSDEDADEDPAQRLLRGLLDRARDRNNDDDDGEGDEPPGG
jgi:AsmA protein